MTTQPAAEPCQLSLPIFEGPLELLLHLIEREELDITTVALVVVADQYIQYLHAGDHLNLDALADFIAIGARLLLLKSRALLPKPPAEHVLADDEEDPGDELTRQLVEYKRFKEAAGRLRDIETAGLRSYPRIAPAPDLPPSTGLEGVTLDLLRRIVADVLTRTPGDTHVQVVHRQKFSVRDKIAELRAALAREGRVSFRQYIAQCRTRMEVVVSFMAVLELMKSLALEAQQSAAFDDIILVRLDAPRVEPDATPLARR